MAYDKDLVDRLRHLLNTPNIEEKNMFGGYCFLIEKRFCCGVIGDNLLARVGPKLYNKCTAKNYVKQFEYGGRPIADVVCIEAELISNEEDLMGWITLCKDFLNTLPMKVLATH